MKNTIVIYHSNCLDGSGAAYAAWKRLGEDAEYVPANYGDTPPDVTGKEVFILDFSYPREVLIEMNKKAKLLKVIDHHKTAEEALKGLDFALFDMSKSGCVLAWEYFNPSEPVPKALQFIQDRDLWRFSLTDTKDYCAGIRSLMTEFTDIGYYGIDFATEVGGLLNDEFEKDVAGLESRAHEVVILADGVEYIGLAVNATSKFASELGNRLVKKSGTFGLTYSYDGARKEWQYSFRSVDSGTDVSEICKYFGGGGHRNAAGCASGYLLWAR